MSKNQIRVLYAGAAWFLGLFIYKVGSTPGGWDVLEESLGFTIGYSAATALPVLLILFFWFRKKRGSAQVHTKIPTKVPTPAPSMAPTVPSSMAPTKTPTVKPAQAPAPPKMSSPQQNGMAEYWYQKALLLTDESQYLECFQCLKRAVAADPTHVQALYGIAHHYLHGNGVQEDLPLASKWFCKAADLGFSPAQDMLGIMYEHGIGVAKNWREAAKWYLLAAENGFADAQYHLGVIYANGQGFPIDFKTSIKWCRRAAEQGHSEAQSTLGRIYLRGADGVPKDSEEAATWLRKAAEQGDAESQFEIGYLFELGDGVPQDLEEAARYYSLAAEQGYADGQQGLQRINMTLGRHTISMEPLPDEEDWQYKIRRMVEQTRFQPPKRRQ